MNKIIQSAEGYRNAIGFIYQLERKINVVRCFWKVVLLTKHYKSLTYVIINSKETVTERTTNLFGYHSNY